MDDYIYFSEEDGNKLISRYEEEMLGTGYVDGINGKTYSIETFLLTPANPEKQDEMWRMMLDLYNGGSTSIEMISEFMKSLQETKFAVSMISKEHSTSIQPEFRIHSARYVVDENGDFALGFGLILA